MCVRCERVRRGSEAATLARIIHECRRDVRDRSPLELLASRPPEAYRRSVEEAEREKPRRARGPDDVAGYS